MKIQAFLSNRPAFTFEEFREFLAAKDSRNVKTHRALLWHYLKTGRILRVRRGLYVTVPPGLTPESSPVDPYLVTAKMSKDAVLAYHTALELHGKAYSVYTMSVYLTRLATRPVTFRGHRYRGLPFPKTLRAKKQEAFGVELVDRAGLHVRVTSLERTLVDVVDRPSVSGGWEEIWRSLESVEFFDLDKVVEYALLLGNATTTAKVGFYLEQHSDTLMVTESHLKWLRELRPRNPHYMVRKERKRGRLVAGWNLVVPEEILERSWEEQ